MSELKENRARYIEVNADNLPLHCPMPDMVSWNQHPRVFLPIVQNGAVMGVLDIDSPQKARFTAEEEAGLRAFTEELAAYCRFA